MQTWNSRSGAQELTKHQSVKTQHRWHQNNAYWNTTTAVVVWSHDHETPRRVEINTKQEVKVIWQKAPHGGPIPRLGVTPGGRKLYHW